MSNYDGLYVWSDDFEELVTRLRQIEAMAEGLEGLGFRDAARLTERVAVIIRNAERQVTEQARTFAALWRAIEKYDNGDTGLLAVVEAIHEWRGLPKLGRMEEDQVEVHYRPDFEGREIGAHQYPTHDPDQCPACALRLPRGRV